MFKKKIILLITALVIFGGLLTRPIFSMEATETAEGPSKPTQAQPSTIKINLKDGSYFEIPAQAAMEMSDFFKKYQEPAFEKEQWEDKFDLFDDKTVTFVCRLLPKAYDFVKQNPTENLPEFIKKQLQNKLQLNLQNVWNFADFINCSSSLLKALAKTLAKHYCSTNFLEKEYKPGYFDNFQLQNILLDAIKQKIWEKFPKKYTILQTITEKEQGHTWPVVALALSADKQTLVSGSDDETVKIWKLQTDGTYKHLQTITKQEKGHTDIVSALALSSDKQILVSGSNDETVKIWKLQTDGTYKHLQTITKNEDGHTSYVEAVALSNDKQLLVSGSNDKTIKIWKLQNETYKLWQTITLKKWDAPASVFTLTLNSDMQTLVFSLTNGTIKVWIQQPDGQYTLLQTFLQHAIALTLSNDKQTLVSGSGDHIIKIRKLQTDGTYQLLQTITKQEKGHTDIVSALALSSDKQILVSGSDDKTIKIWILKNDIDNYNFDQTMRWLMKKLGIKPAQQVSSNSSSSSETVKKKEQKKKHKDKRVKKEKEKEKKQFII